MNSENREKNSSQGRQNWPETQWSIVINAKEGVDEKRHQAIEKLVQSYMPALRAHLVLRKRMNPEQADDFLQDFFLKKIIEQNIVQHADYSKGKFRSFILKSLENFLRDYFRSRKYKQRDVEIPEDYPPEEEAKESADIFDKAWAFRVFHQAVQHFQLACEHNQSQVEWIVYRERMLRPVFYREMPCSYEELAEKLDGTTADQARNLLTKAKRNFAKSLRFVIREYVEDEAQVEGEIDQLLNVLKNADKLDDALAPFLADQNVFEDEGSQLRSQYASIVFEDHENNDEEPFSDEDLSRAWQEILRSKLFELVPENQIADASIDPDSTVGTLLFGMSPSIYTIDRLRRFAKTKHGETREHSSFPCYFALYLLCIAVGVYKCDKLLTQLKPEKLERNFDIAIAYPWLDGRTSEILKIARKLI